VRIGKTTTKRVRVPRVSHARESRAPTRIASLSSPSIRCPDMAASTDRRPSRPTPRVLDAHPVYTVSRNVSHDALTRRRDAPFSTRTSCAPASVHCTGKPSPAPYIIKRRPGPRLFTLGQPVSQTALDLIVRILSSQLGDGHRWERRSPARSHRK